VDEWRDAMCDEALACNCSDPRDNQKDTEKNKKMSSATLLQQQCKGCRVSGTFGRINWLCGLCLPVVGVVRGL
jgi:hypothetical protein